MLILVSPPDTGTAASRRALGLAEFRYRNLCEPVIRTTNGRILSTLAPSRLATVATRILAATMDRGLSTITWRMDSQRPNLLGSLSRIGAVLATSKSNLFPGRWMRNNAQAMGDGKIPRTNGGDHHGLFGSTNEFPPI